MARLTTPFVVCLTGLRWIAPVAGKVIRREEVSRNSGAYPTLVRQGSAFSSLRCTAAETSTTAPHGPQELYPDDARPHDFGTQFGEGICPKLLRPMHPQFEDTADTAISAIENYSVAAFAQEFLAHILSN